MLHTCISSDGQQGAKTSLTVENSVRGKVWFALSEHFPDLFTVSVARFKVL